MLQLHKKQCAGDVLCCKALVFNATLMWLIIQEDFNTFTCHEGLKSYK
jgi:hypothetical protein